MDARKQLPVRVSVDIKERLRQRATENRRSVTKEIEHILAMALTPVTTEAQG